MQNYTRRTYQRGAHFNCTAKVSSDGVKWRDARVSDISSGGLSLASTHDYQEGDILYFELKIEGFLSEFDIKTTGTVRRKGAFAGENTYGIAFTGLSETEKIRIDESVQADRIVGRGAYEND